MNTKNNARSQNTRSRIKAAFLELIDEGRNPEEVTVTALCQRAGIHRSSFYLHYMVPTEILSDIETETMSMMSSYLINLNPETTTEAVESMLCFIRDKDLFFRTILLTVKGEAMIGQFLTQNIIGIREAGVTEEERLSLPYLRAYLSGGSKDILRTWMGGGYREDPKYIAQLLIKFNKASILSLFHEAQKNGSDS